eukprot:TRINITY_DN13967_c0_g1_i2.p1 TRINITY_DN13967_c0_g1~~TRINITY_DN13967_c0_g1_i2.p1  ORF type:complete len:157 (+),score=24.76 TRINITY_DN13967_c0_g1_i2:23-493(+)
MASAWARVFDLEQPERLRVKKPKLTDAERKALVKERKEINASQKVAKRIDQEVLAQLSSHAGVPLEQAARILALANQGDSAARRTVRGAREARHLETRIRLSATKGGITIEEARELHNRAHAGDESAKAKIQEIRQKHANQTAGADTDFTNLSKKD